MALQDLTPQLRTRLSRMERAVGWFVLLASALLLFGFGYYLYHTAERKGWFVRKARFYIYADRASGLKVGDPVKLMGFDVGQITVITSMPAEEFEYDVYVEFEIKSPYDGYLWTQGSRAKLTSADLLGKRSLEVTRGTNGYAACLFNPIRQLSPSSATSLPDLGKWVLGQEVYDATQTNRLFRAKVALSSDLLTKLENLGLAQILVVDTRIQKQHMTAVWNDQKGMYDPFAGSNFYRLVNDETPAVTERLEQLVSEIEQALPNVLALTNRIALVLDHSADLTSNLNGVALGALPAVSNLAAVTAKLDRPGALGEWLLPTNVNRGLESTLSNANTTLASANTTLTSADTNLTALAEELMHSLNNLADITSNLNQQVQANTNMLSSISSAIAHTDEFVQGLKRHWLLRSAFKSKNTNAPPATPQRPLRSPKAGAE